MIAYSTDEQNRIFEITINGRIDKEDFSPLIADLERKIAEWGDVRVLKIVKSVGSITPAVLVDDLKFGAKHFRSFTRVAAVTDNAWVSKVAAALGPLFPGDVKVFGADELAEARRWLVAGHG